MPSVDISIVFATYNGMQTLPRMMQALTKLQFPRDRWIIVAVDNASTDGSGDFLRSFAGQLPIEVYVEQRQGKSYAMNLGLDHVEGELAVLTDDDVIPQPDWLDKYWEVSQRETDYDVFGGAILPDWPRPPDQWILDWVPMGASYATNCGIKTGAIPAEIVYGPNSAFRTRRIFDGCRFETRIGPSGASSYAMGNDTDFANKMAEGSGKAYHTNDARVFHMIRENQMSEDWILRRAERLGLGVPRVRPWRISRRTRIAGVPYSTWLRFIGLSLASPLLNRLPRSAFRFHRLWRYYYFRGLVTALRTQYSEPKAADS